jgi:very-short-patch-repair endonuclease
MKRYPHYLINLARQFRKRATPAEAALWERLRNKKLAGFKFVRQFHVERYIVDFCCREQKLVVELEGGIHEMEAQKEYDRVRFEELELRGMTILRFNNEEIFQNMDSVLEKILTELRRPSPPTPLPLRERGDQNRREGT